jgi:hypothetical protein
MKTYFHFYRPELMLLHSAPVFACTIVELETNSDLPLKDIFGYTSVKMPVAHASCRCPSHAARFRQLESLLVIAEQRNELDLRACMFPMKP